MSFRVLPSILLIFRYRTLESYPYSHIVRSYVIQVKETSTPTQMVYQLQQLYRIYPQTF
ncbi:hypothetical protein EV696_10193 [Permianibacter aggregans]|uniref:Uncharacterized protein n=1 Tax=Permianibacter aggregans TaxID=1510150 RepID=A0A4R6V4P1_9GAMM|nr:hypothetical protein EV696_10193 [Permianibacter aggregans]